MKKLLLLGCAALAAFAITTIATTPAHGQAPAGGGNPFLDESKNSIDDLHAAIVKSPYTYSAGVYNLSIKFNSNGSGEQKDWKFKWHAKDAQTIEIVQLAPDGKPNGKKTTYTFSTDYSSYTGLDFDGVGKVTGHIVAN